MKFGFPDGRAASVLYCLESDLAARCIIRLYDRAADGSVNMDIIRRMGFGCTYRRSVHTYKRRA